MRNSLCLNLVITKNKKFLRREYFNVTVRREIKEKIILIFFLLNRANTSGLAIFFNIAKKVFE